MYELTKFQHKGSLDTHPIARLCRGEPVVLAVVDTRMRKKKRLPKPRLFLTPLNNYGGDADELLVSLEGRGAEVMRFDNMRVSLLCLMGITHASARVLIELIQLMRKP